jgi:hypothetical protein
MRYVRFWHLADVPADGPEGQLYTTLAPGWYAEWGEGERLIRRIQ